MPTHAQIRSDYSIAMGKLPSSESHKSYRRVFSDDNDDWDEPQTSVMPDNDGLHTQRRTQNQMKSTMAEINGTSTRSLIRETGAKPAWLDEGHNSRSSKPLRRMRRAITTAASLAGLVLFINLILLIVGMTRFKPTDGIGLIYTGDCSVVKYWNTALHVLINILGMALLGASSFTMQCLSSPTRSEVDRAHGKRTVLDIGVVSLRNLSHLDWKRGVLWWFLALSSLPLHLLWNSTTFSTLSANSFLIFFVTEGFFQGHSYTNAYDNCLYDTLKNTTMSTTFPSLYNSYRNGAYGRRLEPSECITAYSATYLVGRRSLLAVTTPTTSTTPMMPVCYPNQTPYLLDKSGPLWNGSSILAYGIGTETSMCLGYDSYLYGGEAFLGDAYDCDAAKARSLLAENGTWYLRPGITTTIQQAYPIDYCLSEDRIPEKCELQYSSYILGVVIACNFIKATAMIATVFVLLRLDTPIFATVGDAVASYLQRSDATTSGWCLLGGKDSKAWRRDTLQQHKYAVYGLPKQKRLFSTVSKTRWLVTLGLCTLYLSVGIVMCYLSAKQTKWSYLPSQIWKLGLGQVSENLTLDIPYRFAHKSRTMALVLNILVANSFQLVLSVTYFLYNSLYTAQCGAMEWASYTMGRKPLRVSWPSGKQRSTYWLHLPYRYGIPLTGCLTLMHFLISQAVFLARVQHYDEDGDANGSISTVGYSPIGILASCCVGGVLILIQLLFSLRTVNTTIPQHRNKSVAISAACHPRLKYMDTDQSTLLDDAKQDISLGKVMWGAEIQPEHDGDIGHCSFTAQAVGLPEQRRLYE